MADFITCVNEAVRAGALSKGSGERILAASNPEAELDNVVLDLTRQKRETALQAVRLHAAYADMKTIDSAGEGLMALLTKSEKANFANIEYMAASAAARFHAKNADLLSRFRTRALGLSQDKEGLTQLVRGLYGETVADPDIAKYAKGLGETFEEMRQAFNKAGGSISKNEKWIAPQTHNRRAVIAAGKDKWKVDIIEMIDRRNMTDDNGRPLSAQELDTALDFVYESISTGGLNKAKDLAAPKFGRKLARRHSDRRFLYFKDADSWIKYNDIYGKSDVLTTLTDHIDSMGHDIALMERFGPNPSNTYKGLRAMAEKAGATPLKLRHVDAVWNVASGKVSQGDLVGVADFMQSTRNILTASTLGGAFLSAISDTAFNAITSKYRGISAIKPLVRQLSLLNPANEADRIAAVKIGLGAEAWLGRAHAANRYADTYGVGPTAKVAEAVMRGSLLAPWTDAGRKAFGMEFSSLLAENFSRSHRELDAPIKKAFLEYGIRPADWDRFRISKPLSHNNSSYADFTQDGGEKFQQMVLSETDFAVPTPDYRVRGITTGGKERAGFTGQAWRSVMMLKSFPITLMTTHMMRVAHQSTFGNRLTYSAALFGSTMLMGGIALQAKDIAAGRDPRNIDRNGNFIPDPQFIAAAIQQGGGLGLFGDFIFSDVNRFGGDLRLTLAGPTGELVASAVELTAGNIMQAVRREETNVLGEAVEFISRYQPKMWQTRLFQDAVMDQLEILADDNANSRFRKIVRRREKDFDQGYWWKPGQPLPSKAPGG
ncbi:hypothetical protein [Zhongshania sp.]|uniref:hypothetical protein n=1 Tax=Zhongshania sp. TaxID=1971902 RepID=UPI001B3DC788|nr:hypothetical protein [Zhongshania sp.]MBQ0795757.1 hypothetical protein [Zhongshania sp.]